MILLFQGDDAVRKVRSVIGNIGPDRRGGETIRDTYGDIILDERGEVRMNRRYWRAELEETQMKLKLWAKHFGHGRRYAGQHHSISAR